MKGIPVVILILFFVVLAIVLYFALTGKYEPVVDQKQTGAFGWLDSVGARL